MTALTGQSYRVLVAKPCLWIFLVAKMSEYCGCCSKFVWPSDDPPEDWEVSWEPEL
jgi:hypothetical protein